ncbi:MAG: AraC family transcriptional regulator [Gemmatimonadetes bacterium]|nr:AraC family transcriptional regulator [Gemmatimonadota bacterium]
MSPPYLEAKPVPARGAAPGCFPRGTVLVLDADASPSGWLLLPQAVADARRRFPTAPLVVQVPEVTSATMALAQRAARLRVRAVVGPSERMADALRPVLTHPDDLGDDVVEWMALRGRALSPVVAELVRRIVADAHRHPQLGDLLAPLGESERTARHRFRGKGLPPPSAWHQAARALHAALCIQAQPQARLSQLALDLGYADHSGFSRQLSRAFGVTPAAVRGTLGWEWLLDRWLARRGGGPRAVTVAATPRLCQPCR